VYNIFTALVARLPLLRNIDVAGSYVFCLIGEKLC
jgi:hypothetical protein